MGDYKKLVEIDEETVANLEHCLERTRHMWEWGLDLWPLDIMSIIEKYKGVYK